MITDDARSDSPHPPPDAVAANGQETRPDRVESARLLGGARELVILHAGREYRLRVTQNGKLILTA